MSHYPIIITGDGVAAQLEPYNENTPVAPYLDSVDGEWQKGLAEAKEWFASPQATKKAGADWTDRRYLDEFFGLGYWTPAKEGEGYEHWSTYNPRSKWDWHEVGGRWSGMLHTRHGRHVNTCTAGELDVDATLSEGGPHALLHEGEWLEAGRMGWFGVVLDQKMESDWTAEVRKVLEGLDPDTPLTLVDCHI